MFDIIITSYEQTTKAIKRSHQGRREVPVHNRQGLPHSLTKEVLLGERIYCYQEFPQALRY